MLGGQCSSGSGVVGLSLEGDWIHFIRLLCLPPPPELAFTAPLTADKCSQNIRACMTTDCPSGTVYLGPKSTWQGTLSSCSVGFDSTVATLDENDCHDVEGSMQTKPTIAASNWVQWRYCEGSGNDYYVMTAAVVTAVSSQLSDLTRIKCCRVKPL